MPRKADPHPLPLEEALAHAKKPLDTLWTNFVGVAGSEVAQARIAFVSADHGAGTTTVAICTALGLARNLEGGVALIEANGFSPAMASYLGLPPTPGLTDVLDGTAPPEEAIRSTGIPGLAVLTFGAPRPPVPAELRSPAAVSLLRRAAEGRRFVIFDAPPVLPHPPARVLLEQVDGVVLVVQARSTRKAAAREAIRRIEEAGVSILGTVVNRFQTDMPFGLGRGRWK